MMYEAYDRYCEPIGEPWRQAGMVAAAVKISSGRYERAGVGDHIPVVKLPKDASEIRAALTPPRATKHRKDRH